MTILFRVWGSGEGVHFRQDQAPWEASANDLFL